MERRKLGVAYSVTGDYVLETLPSLVSILENNREQSEEEKVELKIFFYIQNQDYKQVDRISRVCNQYDVELEIIDASEYISILADAGDKEYNGSLVIDLFLIVPSVLDVDYNILFLQSDVIMNYGHSLVELARYDFKGGRYSCASTIDMQSSPMIKAVMPLSKNHHVFNCGVFLVSPRLYKEHDTFDQYAFSVKERGWKFYPYWNVLRNAYGLRKELCILSAKYQVYPGQSMLKISQWKKIFWLRAAEYYSDEELKEALADPVFIHYINFIVRKPWYIDLPARYKSKGFWPYQDVWNHYANLAGVREELIKPWKMTKLEKLKRFFYDYFPGLYVATCAYFYKKEVIERNKIIEEILE